MSPRSSVPPQGMTAPFWDGRSRLDFHSVGIPGRKAQRELARTQVSHLMVSGANISTDIACRDGSSYTLTIPLPAQSYSIAAGDNSPQPTADPSSPLVFQGSATATPPAGSSQCVAGRATHAYFSATGVSENGIGNPGGPGFVTTDVTDPLNMTFHVLDGTNGQGTFYGLPVTMNWDPLTSANSTHQNPVP